MATYVQNARNILNDDTPDFMDLNSICTPPINFMDSLQKARASTTSEINRLITDGSPASSEVVKAVERNVKTTFAYLVMQLHARGSQTFWREADTNKICAYLIFRVLDQYADVLTNVDTLGFDPTPPLEAVCSAEGIASLKTFFAHLLGLIEQQRALHPNDWQPTELSCQTIMQQYAAHVEALAVSATLTKVAVGAGIVVLLAIGIVRVWGR